MERNPTLLLLALVSAIKLVFGLRSYYPPLIHGKDCRETKTGLEYYGIMNFSALTNIPCKRWDKMVNVISTYRDPRNFPEDTLAEAANYCRNPDKDPIGLWCFKVGGGKSFQYCDVPICDCKKTKEGLTYNGYQSVSQSGLACRSWTNICTRSICQSIAKLFPDNTIWESANFCRNPDKDPLGPWCMVDSDSTFFDYCNVSYCNGSKYIASADVSTVRTSALFSVTHVDKMPAMLPIFTRKVDSATQCMLWCLSNNKCSIMSFRELYCHLYSKGANLVVVSRKGYKTWKIGQ